MEDERIERAQAVITGMSSMGGMVGEALLVVRHVLEGKTTREAMALAADIEAARLTVHLKAAVQELLAALTDTPRPRVET